jgi:hypothetical protein
MIPTCILKFNTNVFDIAINGIINYMGFMGFILKHMHTHTHREF